MVSGAIANQTQWIREAQPGAKIITYLWQELLELFKSGVSTASLLGRVLSLSLSLFLLLLLFLLDMWAAVRGLGVAFLLVACVAIALRVRCSSCTRILF